MKIKTADYNKAIVVFFFNNYFLFCPSIHKSSWMAGYSFHLLFDSSVKGGKIAGM